MNVVVVESPAKAKTINRYLGSDFTVLASYGHVRDLVQKDGSVNPDDEFSMSWEVDGRAKKRVDDIAQAIKGSGNLYLATDPDREGEAISWHVLELLNKRKALADVEVKRVVFHEITKTAVQEAMANPRELDQDLIDAYLARRALDYLVGFTLSPILWRKLPGSRSAGRVQSVALRLICERESEIEIFNPQEYWSVDVGFLTPRRDSFSARLTHLNGEKLDRLSLNSKAMADAAVSAIEASSFKVSSVERKQAKRNPAPPFTTSTLQQEVSRKLRISASQTMRIAQQLYEGVNIGGETVGLITYMRTDSVTLSGEAIGACRNLITRDYGDSYLPASPRVYKTKAKNAQEAHEAIRPTDVFRTPKSIASALDRDQLRVYELIWKRTIACEMESAVFDQVAVTIDNQNRLTSLRANGSVLRFDGFLKLYQEDEDDKEEDKDSDTRRLPEINEAEALDRQDILPEQHFTQPPPRYTEASLVKKMEELGIGRPSTYASIIQVLQDRNYVKLDKRRFTPEDRGRVVVSFLTNFFGRYVDYDFTANLEEQLDDVSGGRIDWKQVLRDFWTAFNASIEEAKGLTITEVIDALDAALGPHFFPEQEDGTDLRKCKSCGDGRLGLKVGKFGGFIGCSNYPECKFTRQLAIAAGGDAAVPDVRDLGIDPETGLPVQVKVGPYGPYVQLGEPVEKEKPKRVSLPKGTEPNDVDLELALKLLALPREVGPHPESGDPILAGIGRYGPYVQHGKVFKSLTAGDDVLNVGMNRAMELLSQAGQRGGTKADERAVGDHPEDEKPILAGVGRFGPYVRVGRTYASIPKDKDVDTVTLEDAVALIAAKKERKGGKKKAPAKKKAAAKKKTPAKKKPAAKKKAAPKKPANPPAEEAAD